MELLTYRTVDDIFESAYKRAKIRILNEAILDTNLDKKIEKQKNIEKYNRKLKRGRKK